MSEFQVLNHKKWKDETDYGISFLMRDVSNPTQTGSTMGATLGQNKRERLVSARIILLNFFEYLAVSHS